MEIISQRQLRNDSGDILRRAASGEQIRIRAGDTTVDLVRSHVTAVDQLSAAGRLSAGNKDMFEDLPAPTAGVEPLEDSLDAVRGDR